MGKKTNIDVTASINRITGKKDQFQKIVRETESFFDMIESNPAEVKVGNLKDIIDGLRQVHDEYDKINRDMSSDHGQVEFANTLFEILSKAEDKFGSIGVMFKNVTNNTQKYVVGLSSIMEHFNDSSFGVKFLDIGARFEELKDQANELFSMLNYDSSMSGHYDSSDISDRIYWLERLRDIQIELRDLDPSSNLNDIIGLDSKNLGRIIQEHREAYEEMINYGLQSIEQLELRRQILSDVETNHWNDRYQNAYKEDKDYDSAIEELTEYISDRKALIEQLKANEDRLFTVDGIDGYISQIGYQIEAYEEYLSEMRQLKSSDIDVADVNYGNLQGVITQLEAIKDSIDGIRDAFEPLTKALSAEDSAFGAMIRSNIEDLEKLQSELLVTFNNIEKLSKKEFNVSQTFVNGTIEKKSGSSKSSVLQAEARELYRQMEVLKKDAYQIIDIFKNKKINFNEIYGISSTLSIIEEEDFGKKVNSRNIQSLEATIPKLQHVIKELVGFNKLLNDAGVGATWKEDYLIKPDVVKTAEIKVEESVDNSKFNQLSDQIGQLKELATTELNEIRLKIEETFNFATLDPKLEGIKSITDAIYQQFVELQNKINALDLNVNIPEVSQSEDSLGAIEVDDLDEKAKKLKEIREYYSQEITKDNLGKIQSEGIKEDWEFGNLQEIFGSDYMQYMSEIVFPLMRQFFSNLNELESQFGFLGGSDVDESKITDYFSRRLNFNDAINEIFENWFVNVKDRDILGNLISGDDTLKQPSLISMYNRYKYRENSNISYDEFLNTPIKMYRVSQRQNEIDENSYLSLSLSAEAVKKFGENVQEYLIRPIDTLGAPNTSRYGFEDEIIVPSNALSETYRNNIFSNLSSEFEQRFSGLKNFMSEVDNEAYQKVLDEIKNGTFTTVDQCIAKFDELSQTTHEDLFKLSSNDIEKTGVEDATKAIKEEGKAAEDATPKKNAFTEANEKVTKSMVETGEAGEVAAEGIKAEAKAVEQSAGAIVEASDKLDKVKYMEDAGGNPISKITTSTTKRENAIETASSYYTYDDENGEYQLSTVTIIEDFKKRAAELKRESDKIALAQKTVDKFISQFESKTAGQAKTIKGFNLLDGFTIKNLDDIETATQRMIDLDNEYNKITKNFRQGTKSMNPFVNAITGIDEMENKILEAEISFNSLNNKPDGLSSEIESLLPLLAKMKSYISEDENGKKTITDIYGLSKAYGELNTALRKANSNIKIQKKFEQWDAKGTNFGLDLEKQLSGLVKQRAQWEKNGQLTDDLKDKIDRMFDSLLEVTNSSGLTAWKKQWSILKDEVMAVKYEIDAANKAQSGADAVVKAERDRSGEYWNSAFKESLSNLVTPQKRPELEQLKLYMLQQAETTKEGVVEQYDSIMTIIANKNKALKNLMSAKGPDEQAYWQDQYSAWFGAWNSLDSDAINGFFEDAGNQAILGANKVNKFNAAIEESKILSARRQDSQVKQETDNLDEAIKLQERLYFLKKQLAKVDAGSAKGQELTRKIAELQDEYDASYKLLSNEEDRVALQEKQLQLEKELAAVKNNPQTNYGKTIYNREERYAGVISGFEESLSDVGFSDDFSSKLDEYKIKLKELKALRDTFSNDPDAFNNDELKNKFQASAIEVENLRNEIIGAFKEYQKLNSMSLLGVSKIDAGEFEDAKSAMIDFASSITDGKFKLEGFNNEGTEMYGVLDKGAGVIENITIKLHEGTSTLFAFSKGTKNVSSTWEQLGSSLKGGITRLVTTYLGFYDIIRYVKQGLTYVKEIDLAMTELKKVTDETDEAYKNFLKTASSTASVIGSTVSDFTDATAAFARLGYNINESAKMAETAIVYKNVADGLDSVEESTESIISTMMAYGIQADDTMSIIDRFNAVGNNFAITSAGIGDAMQRSASALKEGGNTIDESIGLITAANSVIQNPEQVGTALKTLTLRLRGAKVELEEAGLDVENMAESTSTLQAKLKALTHGQVDIMIDANTFKSTTQILREMSDAWEDMTDIERASALELMGGKRQANILSSVITNFETVEDVIETSMNSSGSAMEENAKWLDSIEGKTYQFTNALQTMWSNMLDSSTVKSFIGFGTDAIQFLDTGTGKIVALVAAMKLISKFKGFSLNGIAQGLSDTINKITTAQQTLNTLRSISPLGKGYDLTNVQAYAQAVSSLTAKQQANLLASQGLNAEQIKYALTLNEVDEAAQREAMAHIRVATAKQQEGVAGQQLLQQKAHEIAMSIRTQAAKSGEAQATELNAAADILEKATASQLNKEKLIELMTSANISAATQAEILAKLGLTSANMGLAASIKAIYMANPFTFWLTLATTILTLIPIVGDIADAFTKSAEEIKQEAEEIKNAYVNAVDEINDNLKNLGITDDSDSIKELEREFEYLSSGVDKYGNNISLTSDEYERYRDICEQIVGINPDIAKGYDSATEAIGNNAGVLSKLIALQKEQIRLAAAELVNDENLEILSKDAANDYRDAATEYYQAKNSLIGDLSTFFTDKYSTDNDMDGQYEDDVIQEVLSKLGYDADAIDKAISEYWDTSMSYYDMNRFWGDYKDKIRENVDSFGVEYSDVLKDMFDDSDSEIKAAEDRVEKAREGLIDTLLEVPVSSKDYEKLTSEGKNFLVDWIKSSEIFKTDGSISDDDVQNMRDTILKMMDILVSDVKNIDYNGEKITAQELFGKIYNLNPAYIDYDDYKTQINNMLTAFWNTLSDSQKKEYGFESFEDFTISLGFNFVVDDEAESKMIQGYARAKNISEDEAKKYFDSLPAAVVQRLLTVEWDLVDSNNVDKTINNAKGSPFATISSKTYSSLSESVESYKDILTQTYEIVADNTTITEEYKTSLIDLGISSEELNECFDEQNPLLVKNAKALNNLVKEANKNVAANVKLAKSNARLDYYKLIKQLNNTLNETNKLDDATRTSINSTLEQIDAVERAVYQYQLLEDTLLGVNNAFDEFANAQEIDSLNTYGDSYVEMAQTMYDALYKTGQVGTEAFWSSVEALVPTEVYQSLTDDADRMKAIYDYYNQSILPSLRLDEDELSLDYDAIEEFVENGLNNGVFSGDVENFDLVEGMNLERAADLMGITESQAYALFAELDKYNTSSNEHSFLSQLDNSLEGRIANITNSLEDLNKQKLTLLEDGGYENNKNAIDEINLKIAQTEDELNNLGKVAYNTWQQYVQNDAVIAALSEVEDKTAFLTEEGARSLGIEWDEVKGQTVQQALDNLLIKQLELEEPTVLTAQLAIDNIDGEIAKLESSINNNDFSNVDPVSLGIEVDAKPDEIKAAVEAKIADLKEDKVLLSTTFGIELTEEDKLELEKELNAIETFRINDKEFKVIVNGTSETTKKLQDVIDTSKKIKDKTITLTTYDTTYKSTKKYNPQTKSWEYSSANGTAHVNGTAYSTGSWGAPRTETALVGELGPEMLVRNGRWTTIGDHGAEFTQVKKGDIIFNHKQTEELLSKGYVTGRGKAYASGTAYSGLWNPTSPNTSLSNAPGNDASSLAKSFEDAADSVGEFDETMDWIAIRMEEFDECIGKLSAELENLTTSTEKNAKIDELIKKNQEKLSDAKAGAEYYQDYAEKYLEGMDSTLIEAAKNGAIAITEFTKEQDEATVEAIQNYRDYAQKAADLQQQAEEAITEIANLAKQAIDNIAQEYENKRSLKDNKVDQYDAYNGYLETDTGFESISVYQSMIEETNKVISDLEEQRNKMQEELNKRVESGEIAVGSQEWYDAVNDIAALDTEIIELKTDTENYQDAINEIHWDQFDLLKDKFGLISDEINNLIDLLGNSDLVDESGNWTDEGMASLGLYAQQMEAAEAQAKSYEEQINYLNENWQALGYTEEEYLDKLSELKDGQYDSIQAYYDAQKAIVNLNKTRVDAIKKGIEKEIEAYEELIKKKKEALDTDKSLYDFQKSTMEKEKNIADIRRKIAALEGDKSASAIAQRKKLEAELAEANADLQDSYYDRSVENQQGALDKELDNFKNEKEEEIEKLEKWLEDVEAVVKESLGIVKDNAEEIGNTLISKAEEYNLTVSDAILSPWEDGSMAISDYQNTFDTAMSSTTDQLNALKDDWQEVIDKVEEYGQKYTDVVNQNNDNYTSATYTPPETPSEPAPSNTPSTESKPSLTKGSYVEVKPGTRWYADSYGGGASGTARSGTIQYINTSGSHAYNIEGLGWIKKSDIKGYAKGTSSLKKNGIVNVDELGEELILRAKNGRLTYMEKGSGVIPSDLTSNLMEWGKLDPTSMLDQNRPSVGVHPEINHTEISIDNSIGELIHIDNCSTETLPDVKKIVNEALEKHTQKLNQSLRKYTR